MKRILLLSSLMLPVVALAQTGAVVPYSPQNPTYALSTGIVAAAGTTQATATIITYQQVTVVSASTSAYGVSLPAIVGVPYTVRNRTGYTISVYPPGLAQIENGGAGNAATLPSGSDATYISYSVGQWYS